MTHFVSAERRVRRDDAKDARRTVRDGDATGRDADAARRRDRDDVANANARSATRCADDYECGASVYGA